MIRSAGKRQERLEAVLDRHPRQEVDDAREHEDR
jgi:hypothetical protein